MQSERKGQEKCKERTPEGEMTKEKGNKTYHKDQDLCHSYGGKKKKKKQAYSTNHCTHEVGLPSKFTSSST